ncbi:hypothetical protein ACSQ67_003077 [Phaseolus vulgaris]
MEKTSKASREASDCKSPSWPRKALPTLHSSHPPPKGKRASGWEHKVRPPSKRRCPTLYYSFYFIFLSFIYFSSFFPFFMCAAVREGAKEREVLGTSSQWVALSGHCPSATVSNVKGGEIGDGVAEHVLILKDCHQTNPVEGRRRTTLSKPTREGTEPSPPSLHISYSFIHSFTFHSPPTPPM